MAAGAAAVGVGAVVALNMIVVMGVAVVCSGYRGGCSC